MKTAVAVALYNGERFIREQLDSLRTQTQKPDQVVLCDDGSTDKTVEIVENYIREYALGDCWHLHRNEENLGYIRNFYHAIDLCDAEIVFLSDQDDIWKNTKIERMTRIMEENPNICLLSSRYEIINADGQQMYGFLERPVKETGELISISVSDIMRAYRWPGMIMCLRKTFFAEHYSAIRDVKVPHDLMLTVLAADQQGFYEYEFVGAYHRRHDNNTAHEEHRITKLLDLQRKLQDIARSKGQMEAFCGAELPVSNAGSQMLQEKLARLTEREKCLKERSMSGILRLYKNSSDGQLRMVSLVCDLWLVLFGDYQKIK